MSPLFSAVLAATKQRMVATTITTTRRFSSSSNNSRSNAGAGGIKRRFLSTDKKNQQQQQLINEEIILKRQQQQIAAANAAGASAWKKRTLGQNAILLTGLVTGQTIIVTLAFMIHSYRTDEGTYRMVQAYKTFVPVVLHYRWAEFCHNQKEKDWLFGYFLKKKKKSDNNNNDDGNNDDDENDDDDYWKTLDDLYAIDTVSKLGELQGMYCKYGQTAAGFTNTFGDAWIQEFRKLENQVPPRPIEAIYETIQEEIGPDRKIEDIFEWIDPIPLGSASIGQVHRAKLKKERELVAIKVQYAEAQDLFHNDMHTIRTFCELFAPEHIVVLNALEKQNSAELDYLQEAKNLQTVAKNMKRDGFMPREVVVPQPIMEYTTPRMLVMDLLEGPKLIDGIRQYYKEWAEQHGTTLQQLEEKARNDIELYGIPEKYNGPSAFQISMYRSYLKCSDAFVNVGIALYNTSIILPSKCSGAIANFGIALYNTTIGRHLITTNDNKNDDDDNTNNNNTTTTKQQNTGLIPYRRSMVPPNIPRIIDILMRVHGYQLMKDGVFNSDPHGGNFILLPDGRIGLIDYGATKTLTRQERLSACLLFAALAKRDEPLLFTMCDIGGYKSKYGKRDVLMKLLLFGYDSWGKDVTGGKNIQQFLDELKQEDPWEEVPDNFVLAQFMSIRLRSLALGMNHPIKCSDWWGPLGEQILKQEGHPYETWDHDKILANKPELNMQKYKFA